MKNNKKLGVKLVFCRTLSSQSGASVTMGSIASFLRQNGFEAKLCFLLRSSFDNALKILEQAEKYPIIIAKPNFKDISKLLPLLKRAKSDKGIKRIFLCGPFASLNAQNIMKSERWLDGIIIGNPEETTLDLLNSLSDDCSEWNFDCPGGLWRMPETNEVRTAIQRKLTKSLDELPFPARDAEEREDSNYINLESSRGCYYSCSFCHVPLLHDLNTGEKRMIRDPVLVADEIEQIHKQLGKTLFIFNDPIFWSNRRDNERILKLCDEIKRRRLDIKLYIYLRCNPFPNEVIIKSLAEAGLVRVFLGVENASNQSLKRYNKLLKLGEVEVAWNLLKRYGINIHIGYIVFEPYSTLEDIRENIQYLYTLGKLFRIGVILEPPRVIPGSGLYYNLVKDGLLETSLNFYDLTYSFKFKNNKVANLFYALRDIFLQYLKKKWYQLEYYCVSGELLRTLAKKECPLSLKEIDGYSEQFLILINKANELIHSFLLGSIKSAEQDKNKEDIQKNILTTTFIENFEQLNYDLAVEWARLVSGITQLCGEKPYKELYKGVEEL